jgi:hypothetical protein
MSVRTTVALKILNLDDGRLTSADNEMISPILESCVAHSRVLATHTNAADLKLIMLAVVRTFLCS